MTAAYPGLLHKTLKIFRLTACPSGRVLPDQTRGVAHAVKPTTTPLINGPDWLKLLSEELGYRCRVVPPYEPALPTGAEATM